MSITWVEFDNRVEGIGAESTVLKDEPAILTFSVEEVILHS